MNGRADFTFSVLANLYSLRMHVSSIVFILFYFFTSPLLYPIFKKLEQKVWIGSIQDSKHKSYQTHAEIYLISVIVKEMKIKTMRHHIALFPFNSHKT